MLLLIINKSDQDVELYWTELETLLQNAEADGVYTSVSLKQQSWYSIVLY